MNIHPLSILALMILAHLVADYTLQGCLADLKQKRWWEEKMMLVKDNRRRKYRNDYKAALACHSLYWSLIVCLPLIVYDGPIYAVASLLHGAIHYCIDDAKANRGWLNLVQDQLLHGLQILSVWIAWVVKGGCV